MAFAAFVAPSRSRVATSWRAAASLNTPQRWLSSPQPGSPPALARAEALAAVISEHDVDAELAEGVMAAIDATPGMASTLSSVQSLGATGVAALAAAVRREMDERAAKHAGKAQLRITVAVPKERLTLALDVVEGDTLQDVAEGPGGGELKAVLECACNGLMACSTCHVILDGASYAALPPPEESELDMLDLAAGLTETSRLGCQVVMGPALHGKVLTVPEEVNNLW